MNYLKEDNANVNNCNIGSGTKIWHFANLYGCKIGKNSTIGAFTEIQNDVIIGDDVTISSHSFICSKVCIEDNVFIGHGVMTINDLHPPSFKNTGSKKALKNTIIRRGAIIGSNATIFPVTIGENSKIGAGAVVTKDVPANTTVVGNPAKIISKN